MIFFSWNYRGLERVATFRAFCNLIRHYSPSLIFLMEMKCDSTQVKCIRRKLGFDFSILVDAISTQSGLALLWRHDLRITVDVIYASVIMVRSNSFQDYWWHLWCCHCPSVFTLKQVFLATSRAINFRVSRRLDLLW